MRKKLFTILIVLGFINVAGMTFLLTMIPAGIVGPSGIEPLRIGDSIDTSSYDLKLGAPSISGSSLQMAYATGDPYSDSDVGDMKVWLALDDFHNALYFDVFELRAASEFTEIWVQTNLSWWDPDYHGRTTDPVVTDEQLTYLLDEFDNNIVATCTEYFGAPDFHDGNNALLSAWGYVPPGYYNDSAGRNVVLVENVKDDNYYTDFRFFIGGFFSSQLEGYIDRNIITIDCYDWEHRIGTAEDPWFLDDEDAKPNQFEGTIAHEWQHLLHSDKVSGDLIIMNEGFSTFTEYLCGYGVPVGDINYFLATPDNGLLEWGEQQGLDNILADYGQAFLWTAYLNDHFGGSEFLSYYMDTGIPGLFGLSNALAHFGYTETFHEIFHNYRIANLIHSDWPGGGVYNYETMDLGSDEFIPIRVYDVEDKLPTDITGYSFGYTVCEDDYPLYDTYLVSSYGSDYIRMTNLQWRSITKLAFDGDDNIPLPDWTFDADNNSWHSYTPPDTSVNMPHAAWVNVPETGFIELTFDTYFDIEDYWDYGFVQVSEDGGETWTSLENMYTTYLHDPLAMGVIVANLPGLTGWSGGWITMSFDLSAYHGQEIMIAFRYMTDSWVNYPGWWIRNVVVEQDDVIIDTIDEFFTAHPKCNFMVTLLRVNYWRNKPYYTFIQDMTLDDEQVGEICLFPFTFKVPGFRCYRKSDVMMIVSPQRGPADYSFSVYKVHKWMPWM